MNDNIPIYAVTEGQSFSESAGILQLDVFEKDLKKRFLCEKLYRHGNHLPAFLGRKKLLISSVLYFVMTLRALIL